MSNGNLGLIKFQSRLGKFLGEATLSLGGFVSKPIFIKVSDETFVNVRRAILLTSERRDALCNFFISLTFAP